MITPQMPGGGAVRQAVFYDAPHRQRNDAVGIAAVGHGQIQHVGVEVMVAVPAIVLGIRHMQIAGPTPDSIAQLVQGAPGGSQPASALITQRTTLAWIVP
jgi:hypothetical protein